MECEIRTKNAMYQKKKPTFSLTLVFAFACMEGTISFLYFSIFYFGKTRAKR